MLRFAHRVMARGRGRGSARGIATFIVCKASRLRIGRLFNEFAKRQLSPFCCHVAHFGPNPFSKTMQPEMHAKLCPCLCALVFLVFRTCSSPTRRRLSEQPLHLFTFAWRTDWEQSRTVCAACPLPFSAVFKAFFPAVPRSTNCNQSELTGVCGCLPRWIAKLNRFLLFMNRSKQIKRKHLSWQLIN